MAAKIWFLNKSPFFSASGFIPWIRRYFLFFECKKHRFWFLKQVENSKIVYCNMALKIIDHGTKEYKQMVNCDITYCANHWGILNEGKSKKLHYLSFGAFEDDQMLGCCMLVKIDDRTMRLRQMAVPNNLQGKGVGRALMNFAENISRDLGYRKITMHARKNNVGFYEKFGYKISGDEFLKSPFLTLEWRKISRHF
jgi:predicted GNAT family N-acyltransferase